MAAAAYSPARLGLAAAVRTLLGIGMARFAYTPLIPALVEADWFSIHAANHLGAINLAGYLIGARSAGACAGDHGGQCLCLCTGSVRDLVWPVAKGLVA